MHRKQRRKKSSLMMLPIPQINATTNKMTVWKTYLEIAMKLAQSDTLLSD